MKAMEHWNENIPVAGHIEVSGPNPRIDTITTICLCPLDKNLRPDRSRAPLLARFSIPFLKSATCTRKTLESHAGCISPARGADLFDAWVDSLKIPCTKYGTRKKLILISYDHYFMRSYIEAWLGDITYKDVFHLDHVEIRSIAQYLNDKTAWQSESVPFFKRDFSWLAKQLCVPQPKKDAITRTLVIARMYRQLVLGGVWKYQAPLPDVEPDPVFGGLAQEDEDCPDA